jgi:succinate dehydrogenase/fumarate reductase cytochrome b subunit
MFQGMHFGAPIIYGAKLCITWPLSYHLLNGVRHLASFKNYFFKQLVNVDII